MGRINEAVLAAKEVIVHMPQCSEAFALTALVLAASGDGKIDVSAVLLHVAFSLSYSLNVTR